MYAIIQAGAGQHKVTEGEQIKIDLIAGKKKGDKLTFERVLFVEKDGKHTIGQPLVGGAKVEATVVDNGSDGEGKKGVKVFPLKRRPGDYIKHMGHRQRWTIIKINTIVGG
ncbi:MAG TPA: 50S ribosomal protein L21 [Myxococcota bacterium]